MNEEIRSNEINKVAMELNDDVLEGVAGGSNYPETCPHCGGRYVKSVIKGLVAYVCESCSYTFYYAISPSQVATRPTTFC